MIAMPTVSETQPDTAGTGLDLDAVNAELADASAEQVIRWAHDRFGDGLVMTSSFGAQSAVMLHLVTAVVPGVPVVFIDTGYLFPETYRFAHELAQRLDLNLRVYAPSMTPAHLEAIHGNLWEKGASELELYGRLTKVEPMQRALRELEVDAWLAGLRADQTDHRAGLRRVDEQDGIVKVHPILNWTRRDVGRYMAEHGLPYHPLVEKGYLSIGDVHTTRPVSESETERGGRFGGLRQECGIHLPGSVEEDASRESSGL